MSEIELFNTGKSSNLPVNSDAIPPIPQKSQKKETAKKQKALANPAPDQKIDISEDLEMQSQTALDVTEAIKAREFAARKHIKDTIVNERSTTYKEGFDTYAELDSQFVDFLRESTMRDYGKNLDDFIS